jgi:4-amino-4-deoxy-L-arabinose transferase-like glycosyltransferase
VSAGASGSRRRVGLAGVLLIALLVLALALRLKGVAYGLPYSFVNSDESMVVPKAFHAAQGHLNPHFFFYPSLYFYLAGALYVLAAPAWWLLGHGNLLSQTSFVVDPGPYFLLGRLLSVAMGTASVYLVYRLGLGGFGRAAGLLAALFLAVAPLHVAYSHMAVTDVTAVAFSLLALFLLQLTAREGGRAAAEPPLRPAGAGDAANEAPAGADSAPLDWRGRVAAGLATERRAARWLVLGALAAGLATSTKYNLGMLVLPATVAAVYACRAEVARRAAAGGRAALVWLRVLVLRVYVPMAVAFVVASPFVVLDAPRFIRDFRRQSQIMDRGWLGFEHVGNGFWYNVTPNLTGALGVVLVILAVAGVAWALWRRTRLDLLLAPYVVVYFLYIGTWKELADRYLLPIVPLLILLAVRLCIDLALRWPRARRVAVPAAVVVLVVAFVPPLASSVAFDRELSGNDTREVAREWIQRHIPAGSLIAEENYGPPLVREDQLPHYRARGLDPVAYRVVRLKLPVPGAPEPTHDLARLRDQGVEYVVTSSRVRDRVMGAAADYPDLVEFYLRLEAEGQLVEEFRPGPGERGPVLRVYRLSAPS